MGGRKRSKENGRYTSILKFSDFFFVIPHFKCLCMGLHFITKNFDVALYAIDVKCVGLT